jgi:predicted NAD-dependent protein-ADP-ribosyltransferase YbiA (DUF1768 family)
MQNMKALLSSLIVIFLSSSLFAQNYPAIWWSPVPRDQAPSWEILPQDAKPGEVILSKRNELGVFSNLAQSPLRFDNQTYASVEAFWQMLKYPDPKDPSDLRLKFADLYPYTRDQVRSLYDFESKKAGDEANKIMKEKNIKWISYKGKKFDYKDMAEGSEYHYKLIYQVIEAKVLQNPKIRNLLLKTGDLILKPDHVQPANSPKAYAYHEILMDIRSKLQNLRK